jgi:uncharacterized protein YndB with AHSA1/START domain
MSKKSKGSSAKSKSKVKAKAPKKSASKKSKPAAKKSARPASGKSKSAPKKKIKPAKKAVKPARSVKAKAAKKTAVKKSKPLKASKAVKAVKPVASVKDQKTIVKGSIKEYKKPIDDIKNPVLLKKENSPIPEFKPLIETAVKNNGENHKQKESFPTALKTTSNSSFVSTPVKKVDSYSIKPEKEPPGKFEIEIVIRASAELLYEFLVTPSGLSEWFCDDVNIRNGIYTFVWDGQLQQARLLKTVEEQLVRYQWVDKTDGSYFEFKIQKDDLTNDISLIITDFATDKSEQESAKLLWQSQIDKLLHVMGSYF